MYAIVFWACAVVVLTGLIGRYFYAQLPRTQAGHEMKLEDAQGELYGIELQLQKIFPDAGAFKEYLDWSIPEEKRLRIGLVRTVFLMLAIDVKRNAKLAGLRGRLVKAGQTRKAAREITAIIKKKANLEKKVLLYEKSLKVTKLWLYVHIFAAVVMFLVLAVHIFYGVAFAGWIGDHII
jgi:hypothetical protein